MIQNMIISFIIFKTKKHVKSLSWIWIWIWICNWWLICFVMALPMVLNKHYISMSNITPNQASLIIRNIGYYILSSWHGYRYHQWVNSLTPGRCSCNFKLLIFKPKSKTDILNILCEIALRWMPQSPTDDKSSLVIAWTNVDPVLWNHISSLDHNELTE